MKRDSWFTFKLMKIFGGVGHSNPRRGRGGRGYVGPYDKYSHLLPSHSPSGLRIDRDGGDMIGVRAKGNIYLKGRVWDKHDIKELEKGLTPEQRRQVRTIMNNGGNYLPKAFSQWLYGKDGEKRPEARKGESSADFLNRKLDEYRNEIAGIDTHSREAEKREKGKRVTGLPKEPRAVVPHSPNVDPSGELTPHPSTIVHRKRRPSITPSSPHVNPKGELVKRKTKRGEPQIYMLNHVEKDAARQAMRDYIASIDRNELEDLVREKMKEMDCLALASFPTRDSSFALCNVIVWRTAPDLAHEELVPGSTHLVQWFSHE